MKVLLVSIFVLCFSYFNSNKVISTPANLHLAEDNCIVFTAQIDSFKKAINNDSTTQLVLTTTIKNNLKDTFSYWDNPCIWNEIYSINSKYLDVEPLQCTAPFENDLVTIPPKDSISTSLKVICKKTHAELINTQFKIGFNLSRTINSIAQLPAKEINDTVILWSNTLTIK